MNFKNYIEKLSKVGEMTLEEYTLIHSVIRKKSPCNLLIFGVGHDSELWYSSNEGGRTTFVENKKKWYNEVRTRHPEFEIAFVDYETKKDQYKKLLKQFDKGNKKVLCLNLPKNIKEVSWDVIVIDGPKNRFGRMKSIYMSSILAKPKANIFLHDCDRKIERLYGDRFLGERSIQIDKLGHYEL